MTSDQMAEVVRSARTGDKLKVVFADRVFEGDLTGRLYMILGMHGRAIRFGEMGMFTLKAVADTGKWEGLLTYVITLLPGFDPEYFIDRTIGREMLESVSKIG